MIESPGLRAARLILLVLVPILALAVVHMATGPLQAAVQVPFAGEAPVGGDPALRAAVTEDLARGEGVGAVVTLDRIWMVATLAIACILGAMLPPRLSTADAVNGVSAIWAGIVVGLWATDRASLYDAADWLLIAVSLVVAAGAHVLRRRLG